MIHKLDRRQLFSLACLVCGLAIVVTQNYSKPLAGRAHKTLGTKPAMQPHFPLWSSALAGLLSVAVLPLFFFNFKWGENFQRCCLPRSIDSRENLHPAPRGESEAGTPLVRSELYLELAARNAQLGVWEWDMLSGKLCFDAQMFLTGQPLEDRPEIHIDRYRSVIHAEDRARFDAAIESYLNGQATVYECEYRQRLPTGASIWTHYVGKLVEWDSDGNPKRMTGTYRHTKAPTTQKQAPHHAHEELRRYAQSAKSATELLGLSEMLLASSLTKHQHEVVQAIQSSSQMLVAELHEQLERLHIGTPNREEGQDHSG